MSEFNLSEKINKDIDLLNENYDVIKISHVKEFIRLLKEQSGELAEVNKIKYSPELYNFVMAQADLIDKLCGEKLL